jgi:hypothetical protein
MLPSSSKAKDHGEEALDGRENLEYTMLPDGTITGELNFAGGKIIIIEAA